MTDRAGMLWRVECHGEAFDHSDEQSARATFERLTRGAGGHVPTLYRGVIEWEVVEHG